MTITVSYVSESEFDLTCAEASRYSDSGAYIRAIRNERTQRYARAYREVLMGRKQFADSDGLGTMAAQAVRMNLHSILAID